LPSARRAISRFDGLLRLGGFSKGDSQNITQNVVVVTRAVVVVVVVVVAVVVGCCCRCWFVARGSVADLIDADILPAEEQSEWLIRRGSMLKSSDAALAKKSFEKAILLGAAAAKYHPGVYCQR